MANFRRIIEEQINKLEDFASSENNEGRWVEEEKYLFAKECLENLLEKYLIVNEETIRDERRKFAEWCKIKGYGCYDWYMLIKQYENEQSMCAEKGIN